MRLAGDQTAVSREGKQKLVGSRQLGRPCVSPGPTAPLSGWLHRWDPPKTKQPERGQKQGWNHVPCCPGQYSCH